MSLVNTETGEIVESLTVEEARRLTDRIRLLGESLADTLDKLAELIDEARTGSAWLALGYRSWTEYVSTEFSGILPRLDREPRQEFVRELSARGMSVRAIAPVVGTSHMTVQRDLDRPAVTTVTPDPKVNPQGALDAVIARADEIFSTPKVGATDSTEAETPPVAATPRPPVTGIDGKTYKPTTPTPKPERSGEQQNAEENSRTLASALIFLLAFQHPNQRDTARTEWEAGNSAVPPTNRAYVTPDRMRAAAAGLTALADEWENTHE